MAQLGNNQAACQEIPWLSADAPIGDEQGGLAGYGHLGAARVNRAIAGDVFVL
jgi:hypothetical protein